MLSQQILVGIIVQRSTEVPLRRSALHSFLLAVNRYLIYVMLLILSLLLLLLLFVLLLVVVVVVLVLVLVLLSVCPHRPSGDPWNMCAKLPLIIGCVPCIISCVCIVHGASRAAPRVMHMYIYIYIYIYIVLYNITCIICTMSSISYVCMFGASQMYKLRFGDWQFYKCHIYVFQIGY